MVRRTKFGFLQTYVKSKEPDSLQIVISNMFFFKWMILQENTSIAWCFFESKNYARGEVLTSVTAKSYSPGIKIIPASCLFKSD